MLSVVVNFFNNRREARNTLHSLSVDYQRGARDLPYEVIAVDNGSSAPLDEAEVRAFGLQFRYRYVANASVSPAAAINAACRDAAGDRLLVMIDGAHILSPRVLELAARPSMLFRRHLSPPCPSISAPSTSTTRSWRDTTSRWRTESSPRADGGRTAIASIH